MIVGVMALRSTKRSLGFNCSIRAPIGTSICLLPFDTEIERAVETSIFDVFFLGLLTGLLTSRSVTTGCKTFAGEDLISFAGADFISMGD